MDIAIIGPDAPAKAIGIAAHSTGLHVALLQVDGDRVVSEDSHIHYVGVLGEGTIPKAGKTNADEAVANASILVAGGELRDRAGVARAIAPNVSSDQIVLLSPGGFGGALLFANALGDDPPVVAEVPGFPFNARYQTDGSVNVVSIKRDLPLGVFPAVQTERTLNELRRFIDTLVPATSVLETSLKNTNNLIHPPISLVNAAQIERGDEFRFYREGLSPGAGRLIEAIDRERQVIATSFGVDDTSGAELMRGFYSDQGIAGEGFYELLGTFPPFENSASPTTLAHRYIVDDIVHGLAPMARFATSAGIDATATASLVEILSIVTGEDLWGRAPSLADMGLAGLDRDGISAYVQRGVSE